jgi:predicted outer membrane protein
MSHMRLCANRLPFALTGLALLLSGPAARAQQFVLCDATFTFTKEDADNSKPSKSHYYVRDKMLNAERPKDWTSPVDYRNGTVHIRAEVIEKPEGGAPTTWTLCYIPTKGLKAGYGCTGTQIYKEKGVYEKDVKMTDFWQNECIVWEEGIKEMHLVIKDDSGGAGHAHKRTDPEKFFPTKMRITMIQVAKGAKYDPKLVPNLPVQKPVDADAEFLKKVIPGIDASINIIEFAAKNTSDAKVKDFAERVAKQHKGALKTANDHAKRLKVEVASDPDKDSKEMIDKLSKLKGADLDAAFLFSASPGVTQVVLAELCLPAEDRHVAVIRIREGNDAPHVFVPRGRGRSDCA